ncbi:HC-toxin synthetase [Pyrenophora teres f. teres]|uniref:HC-toxin synthetase n=1 Tax=Pyrenophora teres f. teres TaxID=97479 RepID=A0A6S6W3H1_9PLEO|nr:HC-toxin synthetase [Pyrenophora teres f. teres]
MQSVLARHDTDDRFRAAWERVVQSTAVLRTRIVHSSKMGMLQVVLADGIEWEQANELEQYLEKDKSVSMGLGDSLARYALVRDVGTGKRWMVWTLHHALYDGWSLPQIANLVTEVYHGAEVGKQPGFNAFIKYLGEQDHEAAAAYWQGTLADCQAISFPALPPAVQQPVADATTAFQCPALARRPSDITMSTLIRAAWALLASSYTSSDDVVFGATVTGRNAPVAGIEAMAGPTIATVPVRVRVQHSHKVSEFLHSVQQQATEMIPYEQTGLHETAKVSADARHACSFQTLLIWRSHSDLQDFTTYALMVQCVLADDEVQIIASFDRRAIEPWQVDKMLRQFSFVMQQLATADAEAGIASIDTLTPEDRQQLWEWNHDVPPAIERCIHDLFADQAKARPDAPAICAWDGDMTYGELDVLSGRLAGHLVELGVGPEDIVPLCFEKSMWTVVAMLAVLKAGGAFLLLDPSLPHERLRLMCRKVSAKLSLASEASAPLAKDLVGTVVIVNADSALQLAHHASPITSVRPTHTAYVIFTSGSTGEPKGCRIEHRAASSAVTAHGRYLGMQASTRTLQFASYAFAGSLVELLMNLCHGGCICVLSEEERRTDLASAMCRMKVNWAFLTSTVVDLLTPKSVPSLSILCVGGEPIRASQIVRWGSQVHLRQTYGSSEVSGIVSSAALTTCSTMRDVGRASTGVFWIVDPNNHNRLAPVGAVGEVLVEGPVLGREYIDEPDKTASTFIEAPAWRASLGLSAGQQRLYKTGDLARYKDDGSIELIGRKDNQVKLRGQRIEVEEIEHQARLAEADVAEIAVELIQPKDGEDGMLACFIVVEDSASNEDELSGKRTRLDTRTQRTIGKIQDRLERFLPQYMVPAVFIPILTLPVTWSKKIDRKRLREVGSTFSGRELAELQATTQGLKRQPSTENEKALQQLWAGVLAIDADSIGLDDSFFRLGGDSIAAMKLVGEARRAGIHLTVADLFRNPKLECLSRIGRKLLHRIVEPVLSFSLLPPAIKEDILSNQKSLGKINDLASIVDILPVTHCQKFFLSRGQHDPRIAFNYFYVEMGPQLDLYLLRNSCRKVLDHLSILRSRFVPLDDQWFRSFSTIWICPLDIERTDPLEVPTSFKVVRYKSTHNRLIIRLSHAQYDGVSFPIILRTLISIYQQEPLHPVAEFSTFLAHARKIQTLSGRYWRELLQGSRPIRVTEKLRLQVQEDISPRLVSVEKYMDAPRLPEGITMASLISSAWALVLAHITGEQDIVFGHLVAGRNSDIPEVAEIVGPCLNVIPVRTLVYPIKTSKDLIQSVQDQHVSLGESDSMGWDEIVKDCTDWPAGTMYDSLVQHQNIIARPEISFAGVTAKLNGSKTPSERRASCFCFRNRKTAS